MARSARTRWWLLLVLTTPGCSLTLDWDDPKGGLPCDGELRCAEGYSCLGRSCIADGSGQLGDTCSQTRQCNPSQGLVCSSEPSFQCREECSTYYTPSGDCLSYHYCHPYLESDGTLSGSCVESACNLDTDCDFDEICVPITPTASACLPACEPTYTLSTGYNDGCGSAEYCTPVGLFNQQRLVCVSTELSDSTPEAPYQVCSTVDRPCSPGSACVKVSQEATPYCAPYCDGSVGAPDDCPPPGVSGVVACEEHAVRSDTFIDVCKKQ